MPSPIHEDRKLQAAIIESLSRGAKNASDIRIAIHANMGVAASYEQVKLNLEMLLEAGVIENRGSRVRPTWRLATNANATPVSAPVAPVAPVATVATAASGDAAVLGHLKAIESVMREILKEIREAKPAKVNPEPLFARNGGPQ